MKKLEKFVIGATKFVEVMEWIGAVSCVVLFVFSFITPQIMKESVFTAETIDTFDLGFFKVAFDNPETHAMGIGRLYFIIMGLITPLYALVFRSIHKIFTDIFKNGNTPFSDENVKHVKNIGMYIVCMPIIGLIASIVGQIVFMDLDCSITVELGSVFMGLIIICLSRIFAYGVSLQKDSDGLI